MPEGDLTGKVVILHSNDVHGAIAGYAKLATLRDTLEKRGAEVILADAITLMNAAGYTLATLGNHEFDYSYETLRENLKKAEFPVICANVYENGAPILEPGWVYTAKSGLKIDFLIDGHSHTVMTAGPSGEPIQSTGTKFQYIGVLVIGPDGKIEDHYLVETEPIPADESSPVFAAAQKIEDRVNAEYEVKIAESEVEFHCGHQTRGSGKTRRGRCRRKHPCV